ncbi:MAG: RNA methyltransferase [Muribaculaceae bacterium]|nr:RNA methyltransferase [Muribaculaceae bacterium]
MELSKSKESLYSQLGRKKMRDKHSLFMAEGRKSVADTIGYFEPEAIIAVKGADIPDSWLSADCFFDVTPERMAKISTLSTPPEVLAVYRILNSNGKIPPPKADELYLLLDEVQDPGNLGTIIRTAHWFGIKRIYCSQTTADLYNPKTVQSTMGSLGRVDVIYCDLKELIEANPEMPVYGTLLNGENIYKAPLGNHGFIIMGNEGRGISEALRRKVTSPLLIPPYDAKDHSESLNVAIATAVTLSQFRSHLS